MYKILTFQRDEKIFWDKKRLGLLEMFYKQGIPIEELEIIFGGTPQEEIYCQLIKLRLIIPH